MFGRVIRKCKIHKIDRKLTRVAKDLQGAVRDHDRDAAINLEVQIHELGWEKEKLQ